MRSALDALLPTTAGLSWLLSSSIKAALLLAASWLGAMCLRRSTAAARHQIWALGVVGAVLLPVLCWALPPLLPSGTPTIDGRSLLAPAVLVTAGRTTSAGPEWPSWVAITWAGGALLVSLRFLRGHLAARRLSRIADPAHVEAWLSAQREAAAALGIARDIGLGRIEGIGSPMTLGVLRPRVLLPAAADDWSPERLRAILLHELAHVRRRDTLIQLGAQIACALYWWNPLAWLAAARLRLEREHACDDLVLGAGIRPSSYAADLLEVARCISRGEAAHAGTVSMVDLSWTEARLRRILDPVAPRRLLDARFRHAARGATLAVAVALGCASASPALPTPPTPVPAATRIARGDLSLGVPAVDVSRDPDAYRPPILAPEDTLDLSLVAAEVQRQLEDLKQCYERRLLVRPELSGEVVMHWTIATTGKVSEQCVTQDTLGDPEILTCVNELIASSVFPPRDAAVDISFPFVFTAVN